MRTTTAILSALVVLVACLSGSYAQEGLFNVTKPVANAPYVAGQKLPLVYEVSAISSQYNLQITISFNNPRNATNNVLVEANAPIDQGFSSQREVGNTTVYEHQLNYDIPVNTAPGTYDVVYTNSVTGHNVTIPVDIRPASESPSNPKTSGGSGDDGKSMWDVDAASSISLAPVWFTLLAAVAFAFNL
ncbi:hypothetical protein BJV82DRAFT_622322 [Fennellomyces sp. T-0311]|nr:hypothetical protein BJV82DRAFT_622322 [Fennellomyces sp. T-0311]